MTAERTERIEVHVADLPVIKERIEDAYQQGWRDRGRDVLTSIQDAYERGRREGHLIALRGGLVDRAMDKAFPPATTVAPDEETFRKQDSAYFDLVGQTALYQGRLAKIRSYYVADGNKQLFELETGAELPAVRDVQRHQFSVLPA